MVLILAVNKYDQPKTETDYDDKKSVVCILNQIRNSILDLYVHLDTTFKLTEKYHPQRLRKVLSKY